MLNLQQRLQLLEALCNYLTSQDPGWEAVRLRAERENGWFTQPFISLAVSNIADQFLERSKLAQFVSSYPVPDTQPSPKTVGLVMAGNIPLVGFHDWLCIFLSGHKALVKPSSKDQILIRHLMAKLNEWNPEAAEHTAFADMLKGCDAYIATGSNNSARYFEYYFSKYPSIIRKNRTSVAILTGAETEEQLNALSDDVHLYFGLGCRNVTKVFVPRDYDFVPLLRAFDRYSHFADHNKYRNNYDYQLALLLLNNRQYMTNGSTLLVKADSIFSPISQLNYEEYDDVEELHQELSRKEDLQCLIEAGGLEFGQAQLPALDQFADGVDTLKFLLSL